jgi:hypothetical protein
MLKIALMAVAGKKTIVSVAIVIMFELSRCASEAICWVRFEVRVLVMPKTKEVMRFVRAEKLVTQRRRRLVRVRRWVRDSIAAWDGLGVGRVRGAGGGGGCVLLLLVVVEGRL